MEAFADAMQRAVDPRTHGRALEAAVRTVRAALTDPGFDVNAPIGTDACTALLLAVQLKFPHLVRALLQRGAEWRSDAAAACAFS